MNHAADTRRPTALPLGPGRSLRCEIRSLDGADREAAALASRGVAPQTARSTSTPGGHHGVDRTDCRPPGGFDDHGSQRRRPSRPNSLSPMKGTAPPCRRTGTRRAPSTVPPNVRHLTRFSRHSNTTGPVTASRQERQIVQSCETLYDFLLGFTPSWRHLLVGTDPPRGGWDGRAHPNPAVPHYGI